MYKFLPRTKGIRTVTRELKRFAVVEIEYERCTSWPTTCSLRLPLLLHLLPQPVRFLLLCLYKRGRSSPERHTRISSSSRHKFLSTALLLRSSPSRLAACTPGRDSRPPKPHLLSPVREKGHKVFGERSARLLTSSSRTPRTPTTTSPTTTSSPTSTTSSTTWLARTPTPSPALLLLLPRTCSSPFY